MTYEDRITLDELDRFVRTSQFRDQPVELMVLSACETAEGDERAALGLAGVALKAGGPKRGGEPVGGQRCVNRTIGNPVLRKS